MVHLFLHLLSNIQDTEKIMHQRGKKVVWAFFSFTGTCSFSLFLIHRVKEINLLTVWLIEDLMAMRCMWMRQHNLSNSQSDWDCKDVTHEKRCPSHPCTVSALHFFNAWALLKISEKLYFDIFYSFFELKSTLFTRKVVYLRFVTLCTVQCIFVRVASGGPIRSPL